jgi:hypothetical protein
MTFSLFTLIRNSTQRNRTVGTVKSVAALAARRPAPVVGPSAAAVLVAVVTADAAPSELATVTPEAHEGVTRATVEMLAGTMRWLVPPLFRPVPGSL